MTVKKVVNMIICVVVVVLGIFGFFRERDFRKTAKSTEGIVTECKKVHHDDDTYYKVYFTYKANGETRKDYLRYNKPQDVGSTIVIWYSEKYPGKLEAAKDSGTRDLTTTLVCCLIWGGIAVFYWTQT